MSKSDEIRTCLEKNAKKNIYLSLSEIYNIIEKNLILDEDDLSSVTNEHKEPKWQRNVRNVLQSDKENSNITWNKEEHTYMFL
ncbi:MAG: hypothetical protein KA055_03390 [Aliarcobacter sp.]|nr:hypothetical protein [Aliarcobacter sp.]